MGLELDRPPTLACDFDGTIVTNAWPDIGELLPGAVRVLTALHGLGVRILVHTCRIAPVDPDNVTPRAAWEIEKDIQELREFLDGNGLWFADIHTEPYKPSAELYLDDKGMHFDPIYGWDNMFIALVYFFEPFIQRREEQAATGS